MKDRTKDFDVLDLSEDSLSKDYTSEDCKELTLTKKHQIFFINSNRDVSMPYALPRDGTSIFGSR